LRRSVEGRVVLRILVTQDGNVRVESVLNSDHPEFDRPAIEAVEQWRFETPQVDGQPVSASFKVPVDFAMET
jgi:protein TonB